VKKVTVEFSNHSLGLFKRREDAATWYGVTPRTLGNWIKDGKAPKAFEAKIQDAGTVYHFPIDPPPASKVIGEAAHSAFEALRRGEYEVAEALSCKALMGGRDWHTGRKSSLQPLEEVYLWLANGVAWVRHPRKECHSVGYLALRVQRRRVRRTLNRLSQEHPQRQYWQYLDVMLTNYSLVSLGMRWEKRIRTNTQDRTRIMLKCRALLEASIKGDYLIALVAWNVAQFAALDHHEAMFIEAVDRLLTIYGSESGRIEAFLERDPDTEVMMKSDRIKRFLSKAQTPREISS
jgi:hypothetical protein